MEPLEEDAITTIQKNVGTSHPKKVAKMGKRCTSSGIQKPVNTGTSVRKKFANSLMHGKQNKSLK